MIVDKLSSFIDNLIPYDYLLFGGSFVLFILFMILGIILNHKTFISVFFFILSFSIIIFAPTIGYVKMHEYLFKNETKIVSLKKLHYTKAVVINASLKNTSKRDFDVCKLSFEAYRVSGNMIKDYIYKFKPLKKMSILEYDIVKGTQIDIKAILEPFTYKKDYNISVEASCR